MLAEIRKSKENKDHAVANSLAQTQKKSGMRQGGGLVDNRPESVLQAKILNAITPHLQSKQISTVQRRGFADPAKPNSTRQWEGRGTPWRKNARERPAAVAAKVDQFKKEILTYIAHCIEKKQAARYYGPHVAVVISGKTWNVSVNSDVSATKQNSLQVDAAAAKTHIDACWTALNNTYQADYFKMLKFNPLEILKGVWRNLKYPFQSVDEEAVYIAFRWAASSNNVRAISNPLRGRRGDGRRVHGEMQIVDDLKKTGIVTPNTTTPQGATTTLPATWRRVVRVGGTKTPCLDCAWEMDKVQYDQTQINTGTGGSHGASPDAHMIGIGPSERVVTTMAPEFGYGFPTWQSANLTLPKRDQELRPGSLGMPRAKGFNEDQQQNFNALKTAYQATGCKPDLL